MIQHSRQATPPAADDRRARHSGVVTPILILLGLGWVLLPALLVWGALLTSTGFFGEIPTPQEQAHSAWLLVAAVTSATVIALAGVVLAIVFHYRVAAWMFGAALAISMVVGLAAIATVGAETPAGPSTPTHCVERSGGTYNCDAGG